MGTAGTDGTSASNDPSPTAGPWQRAPLWTSDPGAAPPVHLSTFAVPFPQPEASGASSDSPLASNDQWTTWIKEWSEALGEALKGAAEKQDNEASQAKANASPHASTAPTQAARVA